MALADTVRTVSEPPNLLRKRFHQQLEDIDTKVVRLFALVTESVAAATDSLLSVDADYARRLADRDSLVDKLEEDLETLAERELFMQQPMAGDLRYLISVLRVVPELERSGDLATHVAQRAATGLGGRLTPTVRGLIEQMGVICVRMWQAASDAWAERDPDAAEVIDTMDDGLDALAEQLIIELHAGEVALPDAMQTTLLGRFYERLGDHAVHISERISYLTPGT
jgi:phosphate transport system protein